MKKLLFIVLSFCLCMSTTMFSAKAMESSEPFDSFEIIGLEDNEVTTGDILTIKAASSLDVDFFAIQFGRTTLFCRLYETDEVNQYVGSVTIPEDYKYTKDNVEVLFLGVNAVKDGTTYTWYYSDDSSKLISKEPWFKNETIYKSNNYSFDVLDYEKDTTGPSLSDYKVEQNGSIVNFEVVGQDMQSGYASAKLVFLNAEDNTSFSLYTEVAGEQVTSIDLHDYYQEYPYGSYQLTQISLYDNVNNVTNITDISKEVTIELNSKDNVLENLDENKIYLSRDIIFRVNSNFKQSSAKVCYPTETGYVELGSISIEKENYDLTTPGQYQETVSFEYTVNSTDTKTIDIVVSVSVVEAIGEIVNYDYWDICLDYEDSDITDTSVYSQNLILEMLTPYHLVKNLNTNEITSLPVQPVNATIFSHSATESYIVSQANYNYSPIYLNPVDPDIQRQLTYTLHLYFVDDEGNLVSYDGSVIVPYQNRNEIHLTTSDQKIDVMALEGSLPTYTNVTYQTVNNLDSLFEDNYTAYKISFDARIDVNPVDSVKMTVSIPDDLKDKEIAVYNIDENNQKTSVKSIKQDNQVIFDVSNPNIIVLTESHENPNPFDDVAEGKWYTEPILRAAALGIMTGKTDTHFGTTDPLSRAAMATVLYRLAGEPSVEGEQPSNEVFPDVANTWYTEAITWAYTSEIVTGHGNGTFKPNDGVTRQQLALMLQRYAKEILGEDVSVGTIDFSQFSDGNEVASWAREAMQWAIDNGIISGNDNGTLKPKGIVSRAQCAVMMMRFYDQFIK